MLRAVTVRNQTLREAVPWAAKSAARNKRYFMKMSPLECSVSYLAGSVK